MNFSLTFRWVVAVLILITVGWKIVIPSERAFDLSEYLITFLKRNNFSIDSNNRIVNPDIGSTDVPIIQAHRGSCTLFVAALNFDGSNGQLVKSRLAGADRRFVMFQGKRYSEQPIFLTVTNYLWSKFLIQVGLVRRQLPVIAVGSDVSCNSELLPWADLHW